MIRRLSRNHKPRELKVCFAEDLRTAVVQPKHLAIVACDSHTGRRATRAVQPVLGNRRKAQPVVTIIMKYHPNGPNAYRSEPLVPLIVVTSSGSKTSVHC
jgi:hypothetical protein